MTGTMRPQVARMMDWAEISYLIHYTFHTCYAAGSISECRNELHIHTQTHANAILHELPLNVHLCFRNLQTSSLPHSENQIRIIPLQKAIIRQETHIKWTQLINPRPLILQITRTATARSIPVLRRKVPRSAEIQPAEARSSTSSIAAHTHLSLSHGEIVGV